ncbi:MAG: hypothetical protein KHW79_04285 [Clostridiales bacterium]|nr:hypothetical protein [Clostridiales bacterium]
MFFLGTEIISERHFLIKTVIIQSESYQALQKIKAVIHDDSLTDNECFMKIEEIICIFEALGSNDGTRHDFG